MGVWGAAIFFDDTASDVREDYRDAVGSGMTGPQATDKILNEYFTSDEAEMGVVWLSSAATRWKCGRLEERVKERALQLIDSGSDLRRWPEKSLADKRNTALFKLREQLLSPQPPVKRIAKPFRSTCDWELGELVAYRLLSGNWMVLRITDFSQDKGGVYPQCEILDWLGENLPTPEQIAGSPIRIGSGHTKHGQFSIGCATAREFPAARLARLHAKSDPSESSRIRVPRPGARVGFTGGGLPFVLWRSFDQHLEREYGLK